MIPQELYRKSEKEILKYIINEELTKTQYDYKKEIPGVVKRKMIFSCVFAILNLAFISAYFFHFRTNVYLLEIVNVIVYLIFMKKYNVISYLSKEIKARPDEDISYIIAGTVAGAESGAGSFFGRIGIIALSVILPLIIFFTPHTLYEEMDDGYYVRFYTRGVVQEKEVVIPETYNDKPVIGVRGNVFANLQGVEKIVLPDTISTIRGYAFAGSKELISVNMPKSLIYLGGGAFQNCTSIAEVDLPIGIAEIKGNTFENCKKLTRIEIPDGVTRIGGHAFYGCRSLYEAIIPSTVVEIGSSAFRCCYALYEIELPQDTYVNERAFKESPTHISYY